MSRLLTEDEIARQLTDLPLWQASESGSDDAITATYEFDDFAASLDFVNRVGAAAEEMNHHPDIVIRWNKVSLEVSTHSEGGLTQLDIELAHRADAAASAPR